ncbi:MAG: choice-of-anchor V domain-containing protein [Candidatus Zixiibacteriota bacterium]
MKNRLFGILPVATVVALATMVWAFPSGSNFTGSTGAPGESACSCHGNLNTGPGSAFISAPDGYAPGETIDITVSVEENGKSRWGFAVTVLDGSDQPVGQMMVTDGARTLMTTEGSGREYIKQTSTGTDAGTADNTSWSFQWMAPASDAGQVTFYLAGLASNNGDNLSGDNTYTTSRSMLVTDVREVAVGQLPTEVSLSQNYPNPFNPTTTIEFSLPKRVEVELAVYNVLGQKIKVLHSGALAAGTYATEWDGTRADGAAMASGVYYYRLQAGAFDESRKMTLVK